MLFIIYKGDQPKRIIELLKSFKQTSNSDRSICDSLHCQSSKQQQLSEIVDDACSLTNCTHLNSDTSSFQPKSIESSCESKSFVGFFSFFAGLLTGISCIFCSHKVLTMFASSNRKNTHMDALQLLNDADDDDDDDDDLEDIEK